MIDTPAAAVRYAPASSTRHCVITAVCGHREADGAADQVEERGNIWDDLLALL